MRQVFTFLSINFHTDVFVETIYTDLARIIQKIRHLAMYKVRPGSPCGQSSHWKQVSQQNHYDG